MLRTASCITAGARPSPAARLSSPPPVSSSSGVTAALNTMPMPLATSRQAQQSRQVPRRRRVCSSKKLTRPAGGSPEEAPGESIDAIATSELDGDGLPLGFLDHEQRLRLEAEDAGDNVA